MTADRVLGERAPTVDGGSALARADDPEAILRLCDGLLGEIGRRKHRFAWLRRPGAPIDECLVVDCYFPGNRMVVVCAPRDAEDEELSRTQVPAHGLQLLWLEPERLGTDPKLITEALVGQINSLGPLPSRPQEKVVYEPREPRVPSARSATARSDAPPSRQPAPAPGQPAPPAAAAEPAPPELDSATAAHAAVRAADQRLDEFRVARGHADHHVGTPAARERVGLLLGVALVVIVIAEMLVLVVAIGLGGGHPVLALGFAFDVCSRVLGTIAAIREGDAGMAWTCVLLGSPVVVNYALLGDVEVTTEPAPLGGALGLLAIGLVVLALLGMMVGI